MSWYDAQSSLRRLTLARSRGWSAAAEDQREKVVDALEYLRQQIDNLVSVCRIEQKPQLPSLHLLYDELTAAEGEFDSLKVEGSTISVTTEPITLEDIELGPFEIQLHLDRLDQDPPYTVTAMEPNPAASCSETTHPHVHCNRLCPGEGRAAISAALKDGRLFDFFVLVDRILHTYGEDSAYVALDRWFGVPCHDCDCTLNEDESCTCYHCEENVCCDCVVRCAGCGDGYCSGCIDRCQRCEEHSCSNCLQPCKSCRRRICAACREDDLCETCREELEDQDVEEEADEATVDVSDESPEPAV